MEYEKSSALSLTVEHKGLVSCAEVNTKCVILIGKNTLL